MRNKTSIIAAREYVAAVRSKAFVISLVLMPLMMFGGIAVQRMTAKLGDIKTKRVGVIDRTPGASLFGTLVLAAETRNKTKIFDKTTGKQTAGKIEFEKVDLAEDADEQAVSKLRLKLSDRVRGGELFAFVEIGRDVLSPKLNLTAQAMSAATRDAAEMSDQEKQDLADEVLGGGNAIRYSTNKPTALEVRTFVQETLTREIQKRRILAAKLPADQIIPLITPSPLLSYGLTQRKADGSIKDATRSDEFAAFMVPLALILLMFMVIMVGASPMTTNMIEEKQLRIAEVLLGCARPFELMMGKLLGGVGVALTLAAVYFIGMMVVAKQYNVMDRVSPPVVVAFLVFTVLGTLMYGSLFVAAGAAVTNVKEAQSMITPVVLLMMLPLFILESLLREPTGMLATIASLFPTSAPVVTAARLAIPPGVPLWQMVASGVVSLATTVVTIWAAGRIFRVGILMQGQAPRLGQMLRWVTKG